MTAHHHKIRRLLGEEEARADTSLRAQSLRRALGKEPPRTLTPHEWEQWYAQHGVPSSHRGLNDKASWWRRLRALVATRSH